jgi:hypothetical protein
LPLLLPFPPPPHTLDFRLTCLCTDGCLVQTVELHRLRCAAHIAFLRGGVDESAGGPGAEAAEDADAAVERQRLRIAKAAEGVMEELEALRYEMTPESAS